MAATLNLTAFKRVPFVESDGATIVIIGPDWSDATFKMDIRQNPGDTGTALVSLSNATAGTQGISATFEAEYTFTDSSGASVTAPATKLLIQINESTIEALSLGTPSDQPITLFYDIHISPSGGVKQVFCEGSFTIKPGVTV